MSASLRSEFALDPAVAFLNHGSFGARPREVAREQARIRADLEANPVEFLGRRSGALIESALSDLGRYVGAAASDLAFVENATTGVGVAARSLALGPGDEVVASDHEYGACALAWRRACAAKGASYRAFAVPLPYRGDDDFMDRLDAAMGPRTRIIFLSHVTSPTALAFPVARAARLARDRGAVLVVDGAHAPGQLPLDLEALGAAFYTGNCHKWLCAPLGSAFLYARPELHGAVEPPIASWGLVAEDSGTSDHDAYAGSAAFARRLRWLGTRDPSACLSTPAALRFMAREDVRAAFEAARDLAASASERVAALFGLDPLPRSDSNLAMALAPLPPCDGTALKARLYERHRVEVPVIAFAGRSFLRISCHVHTAESDVGRLLEGLATSVS